MNRRIVIGTVGCLALLGLAGCFYPPDTQPIPTVSEPQPEEVQLTSAQSNQLRNLHHVALQKFLEVPDLGMNRMGIGTPLYIVPSDVLDRTVAAAVPNPVERRKAHTTNTTSTNRNDKACIGRRTP